jgi:hypothetical protein
LSNSFDALALKAPSRLAVDIPADILARRPDVQAAEMRVREALDRLDSTRTSFYPTLSLTGSAGTTSDALRNLLQNPVGTLAASLGAPFLNVWTMKPTVGIARASYDAAVVAFQKTFYQALTDVGNALAAREYDDAQIAQTEIAATLRDRPNDGMPGSMPLASSRCRPCSTHSSAHAMHMRRLRARATTGSRIRLPCIRRWAGRKTPTGMPPNRRRRIRRPLIRIVHETTAQSGLCPGMRVRSGDIVCDTVGRPGNNAHATCRE